MNNVTQAIWVETLKARRSRLPLFSALGFALIPLAGGFFMIVLKDPELARQIGLISAKAQITMGVADWPSYLGFLALGNAVGGVILYSLVGSWVFGREYADRTVKDLLALPTSRSAIVCAKFIVITGWCAALTVLIYLIGLGVGIAVGLPPASLEIILQGGITLATSGMLTVAIIAPIIFFASAGHGYLPPMGVAILVVGLAQLVAVAGWGEYFPWAIPGLVAQGEDLGITSYMIVIFTSIAGIAGTFLWWELADQSR